MKYTIALLCLILNGCTVLQDARTEFRREMAGFKYNWDRSVLKKDVPYAYE